MGIGNPDITIKSALATYNDGAWHFLTATRDGTAGAIVLYVDGSLAASTTGTNTVPRTAPPLIGLGRNPCVATGVYTGSLDDIVTYRRSLSGLRLQANPVRGEAILINSGQQLVKQMQIMDLSGRILLNVAPHSSDALIKLNIANLRTGFYLLRVNAGGKSTTLPLEKL